MLKRSTAVLLTSLAFLCAAALSTTPLVSRQYDAVEIEVDQSKHDVEFFTFVTRPDLDPPRLNVTLYDESAVSPGYIFVAPYAIVEQKNKKPYVGPHIYDQVGNLIWSGSGEDFFDGYNTFDFRVANVNGQDMLTVIYPHTNNAVILDNTYEVYAKVDMGVWGESMNMHGFSVVDSGTRALFMTQYTTEASVDSSKTIGFDGMCRVQFKGFEERIISTGEVTFRWTPEDRIRLDESVLAHHSHRTLGDCATGHGWDYLHPNSVDKLPDGDYLVSGRHTNALYKISSKTGEILWRFGGMKSDFSFPNGHFSGQHDVQCHFQNSTHMIISILDNAMILGWGETTNKFSRALRIRLDTEEMTAEHVKIIDHPYHDYAPGRGNYETLPNGNAFLTWRAAFFISEHTPDNRMIMEGNYPSGLKTYRAFKFPWTGRPSTPPDVHSQVAKVESDQGLATTVHVSWNGDTEVASWTLYKVNADASVTDQITSVKKEGFESALTYPGYAKCVVVAGFDKNGVRLVTSSMVQTAGWQEYQQHPAVLGEWQWLETHPEYNIWQNPLFGISFGAGISIGTLFSIRFLLNRQWNWRRKSQRYAALSDESEQEASRRKRHSGFVAIGPAG